MERIEITSWVNTALKTMWVIACLGLIYVAGKKVGEYLLTDSSELLAKEIIAAYQKAVPSGSDTLVLFNNTVHNDTFFIEVLNNALLVQFKSSALYLSENWNVVAYHYDRLFWNYNQQTFTEFSIEQFNSNQVFETMLKELKTQNALKENNYDDLKEILQSDQLESL
jgi:hypothetical protein